ncbi:MAG TPA: peroxiredoxin [Ignavibacteriaceae bacterium]|nr:peroxiredoxin [Ignavibacteriaceae bacterium]
MSIKVGDMAPDFSLVSSKMEKVSLSDFRGKNVVLLFFPFAGSGVCTKEMCNFRDEFKQYEELDAQVLGVSVDSVYGLNLFAEKNDYKFPLLSDFNKEVIQSYGVFDDLFAAGKLDYKGVAKRSAFVIDKEGKVKYAEVLASPGDEPNYEAIKETLK